MKIRYVYRVKCIRKVASSSFIFTPNAVSCIQNFNWWKTIIILLIIHYIINKTTSCSRFTNRYIRFLSALINNALCYQRSTFNEHLFWEKTVQLMIQYVARIINRAIISRHEFLLVSVDYGGIKICSIINFNEYQFFIFQTFYVL